METEIRPDAVNVREYIQSRIYLCHGPFPPAVRDEIRSRIDQTIDSMFTWPNRLHYWVCRLCKVFLLWTRTENGTGWAGRLKIEDSFIKMWRGDTKVDWASYAIELQQYNEDIVHPSELDAVLRQNILRVIVDLKSCVFGRKTLCAKIYVRLDGLMKALGMFFWSRCTKPVGFGCYYYYLYHYFYY